MIRYKSLATFSVMLVLAAVGVTATVSGASAASEEDAVLAAEDEWIRAEFERDEAALRRVIDDRFVANSNNGETSGKEALIETVLGFAMTGQTISERSVLVAGDTAVVFGTTELRFASPGQEDTKSLLRYTTTYVKRDGQWRALALHMARRTTD